MNYNSEKYGFEFIQGKKYKSQTSSKVSEKQKKPIKSKIENDKAIEFSKKIVEILSNKAKAHNEKNKKKVTLKELKKIYRLGVNSFLSSNNTDKNCGIWAMAKVNMFLEILNNKPTKDFYRKLDSNIAKATSNNYTIQANFQPSEENLSQAEKDIKKYNLDNFNFTSVDELYLDDEDDGFIFTFEV